MSRLVLYGRPGCHLCDEARAALERIGHPFDEIDIESDDALFKRLLERIPVVELDGEELSELRLDEQAVRARIASIARP